MIIDYTRNIDGIFVNFINIEFPFIRAEIDTYGLHQNQFLLVDCDWKAHLTWGLGDNGLIRSYVGKIIAYNADIDYFNLYEYEDNKLEHKFFMSRAEFIKHLDLLSPESRQDVEDWLDIIYLNKDKIKTNILF